MPAIIDHGACWWRGLSSAAAPGTAAAGLNVLALHHEPGRSELGGEVAEISVLFADLVGYTAYADRVTPAQAAAVLNAPEYQLA